MAENRNENVNFTLDTIHWDTYWRNKGPDCLESTILKMKGKLSLVIYSLLIWKIVYFACYLSKIKAKTRLLIFKNNKL